MPATLVGDLLFVCKCGLASTLLWAPFGFGFEAKLSYELFLRMRPKR
jgi:hypothetical protein